MGANLSNNYSTNSRRFQILYRVIDNPELKQVYDLIFERYLTTKELIKVSPGKESHNKHIESINNLHKFQRLIEIKYDIKHS